MGERPTFNREVVGSNPTGHTNRFLRGAVSRSRDLNISGPVEPAAGLRSLIVEVRFLLRRPILKQGECLWDYIIGRRAIARAVRLRTVSHQLVPLTRIERTKVLTVAQVVERLFEEQGVAGSNPAGRARFDRL